jgi:hypothetical protein
MGLRDATVLRLTNYIFALSAANYAQIQAANATGALVTFR